MIDTIRVFALNRQEDVSGVSGTGVIALVVEFPNEKAVVAWLGDVQSVIVYDSIEDVKQIHGHDGKTLLDQIGEIEA